MRFANDFQKSLFTVTHALFFISAIVDSVGRYWLRNIHQYSLMFELIDIHVCLLMNELTCFVNRAPLHGTLYVDKLNAYTQE